MIGHQYNNIIVSRFYQCRKNVHSNLGIPANAGIKNFQPIYTSTVSSLLHCDIRITYNSYSHRPEKISVSHNKSPL